MLATDLAMALDPVELARKSLGLEPDDWQARLLRSPAPRILVNCSRQSGKSTTAGELAVHTALYEPGAPVLLVSPTLRQSGLLFRKALDVYRGLDSPVPAKSETALQLHLANGSSIISLPGKEDNIRGFSAVRLLIVDEAAWVPDGLYASVRPFLAVSGGRLIALSTPFGKRGWWFDAYTSGDPAWERYEVPATEVPRIPAAFLEEERKALGPWRFAQEYMCQFGENDAALFSYDIIQEALSPEVRPLWAAREPVAALEMDATVKPLWGQT
jgi:hypothetical protein